MATSLSKLYRQAEIRSEMVWTTDRYGRPVKRPASLLSDEQQEALKQAERRAAYELEFCIFEEVQA